ncbi:MAG: hypothetical protein IJP97_04390, partial [Synergistaceae bacterium]|nr:hypothetical protein [Synergistaceae bacterium]
RAEVHILDFHGDVYDSVMPVFFLNRIRDVIAFNDKTELMTQIENDIHVCRRIDEEVMRREDMKKFFELAKRVYYSKKDFVPEIIQLT